MISTQKLSDLAFCVHDGMMRNEDDLNATQKKFMLKYDGVLLRCLFKSNVLLIESLLHF